MKHQSGLEPDGDRRTERIFTSLRTTEWHEQVLRHGFAQLSKRSGTYDDGRHRRKGSTNPVLDAEEAAIFG